MNIGAYPARAFLWLSGWRLEGELPTAAKYVLIAAPHTSNWDFPYMLALAWRYDVRLQWMGKHTLFRFPYGWAMRRMGGIPIRRHERAGPENRADLRFWQPALVFPKEFARCPRLGAFYHRRK